MHWQYSRSLWWFRAGWAHNPIYALAGCRRGNLRRRTSTSALWPVRSAIVGGDFDHRLDSALLDPPGTGPVRLDPGGALQMSFPTGAQSLETRSQGLTQVHRGQLFGAIAQFELIWKVKSPRRVTPEVARGPGSTRVRVPDRLSPRPCFWLRPGATRWPCRCPTVLRRTRPLAGWPSTYPEPTVSSDGPFPGRVGRVNGWGWRCRVGCISLH